MRIAYDPQIFFNQIHGGISRYFVETARCISAYGEDVAVFAPANHNEYLMDGGVPILPASQVAVWLRKLPPRLQRRRPIFISPAVRQEIRWRMKVWRPDVVHETYYSEKRLGPRGAPAVLTVYDMIHERFPDQFEPTDPTRLWKRTAVERADRIICISHHTAKDLQEILGVPPSKIEVVHLGCNPLFHVLGKSETDSLPRPYLLYVGARLGYKNFLGLLQAYASHASLRNDFDLVAFGGGPISAAEGRLIDDLGVNGRVIQISGDDRQLSRLYSNARAYVCPSRYEGFGLPPLEAMSYNCPVVSSDASCLPEVVGDAAAYFNPNDRDAMSEAIATIAYSDTNREALIDKGKRRLENFSWNKCADETLAVYRTLLG